MLDFLITGILFVKCFTEILNNGLLQRNSNSISFILLKTMAHNSLCSKNFLRFESSIFSVIRQKGESQNGANKKVKDTNFSEKRTLCVSGGKKLVTSVLRFALLSHYRRYISKL